MPSRGSKMPESSLRPSISLGTSRQVSIEVWPNHTSPGLTCAAIPLMQEGFSLRYGRANPGAPAGQLPYDSIIDDKTTHEMYLWPFADAVRAGAGAVMCSYNLLVSDLTRLVEEVAPIFALCAL